MLYIVRETGRMLAIEEVFLAGHKVVFRQETFEDGAVRMVGKVDFDETRLNYITAWIPGRLDRMYVDYTGTLVRKDDHLVQLYSPQLLSAQEELLQALKARQTFRDGSSKLMLETAEQTVRSSREKLRLWGLGLDQIEEIERSGQTSDHVTIRAPIGGIVVHKNKNTGDYVNTGERVYTIADLSQVWVELTVGSTTLPRQPCPSRVSRSSTGWAYRATPGT